MSDTQIFPPSAEAVARTLTTKAQYDDLYARSLSDPDAFWAEQARRLDWFKFPTKIKNTSFAYPNVSIKWFEDGVLNVSYNCLDRHLEKRGDQVAIIWEGDVPGTGCGNAVAIAVWKVTLPSTFCMIWWMCPLSTVTEPKRLR